MIAKVICFPRVCCIPSAAIEDQIESLIEILDEREAPFEDLEPDLDTEENGDAEEETWPEIPPSVNRADSDSASEKTKLP